LVENYKVFPSNLSDFLSILVNFTLFANNWQITTQQAEKVFQKLYKIPV